MGIRLCHLGFILVVGLLGPDLALAGGPRTPGQLVIGLAQAPANMHPAIEPHTSKALLQYIALRRLTVTNPDQQIVCQLCVEVPTIANGLARIMDRPDGTKGMVVTYNLRPDNFWADGTPVSSADIVFSFEAGRRSDMGFQRPDVYAVIDRVEAPEPMRAVVYLKNIQSNFNVLDWPILPAHVEREIVKTSADPADFRKNTLYNRAPTTPGLWNGPYRLAATEPGVSYSFEPNPHWKGKVPGFKRIIVRVIENTSALEQNLLSGDIDYIFGELGLTVDQAISLEERAKARFDFSYPAALAYEHVDINLDNPILKDVRVRRALLAGLDREMINTRLFKGKQPVAATFVSPKQVDFDPSIKPAAYDPKLAARLLDEAGWKPGAGGIRTNAEGKRLQIELITTAGNKQRELVQTVLQSQWKQIGVDIVIRNEQARILFGRSLRERRFSGLALYAWSSSPNEPPSMTLASNSIPTEANNYGGSNYPGWANPEFDAAIIAAARELDPIKRQAIWTQMQRLYADDLPVIPLYFRVESFVLPQWLKGIRPTGHAVPSTAWVEDWHVQP